MSKLPDHSRVWVYTASRPFTDIEVKDITRLGTDFVGAWKAHGAAIDAHFKVYYNHFIVIAANEEMAGVSGCGIDSSVNLIKQFEKQFNLTLLDKLNLGYHTDKNTVAVLPMIEFQNNMDKGVINEHTIVFNNLVNNLGEFRTSWEVPLIESWHKQLL